MRKDRKTVTPSQGSVLKSLAPYLLTFSLSFGTTVSEVTFEADLNCSLIFASLLERSGAPKFDSIVGNPLQILTETGRRVSPSAHHAR